MIGRVVSHYRIERELGRGGMGVVYAARDLRLDRLAAVKMIAAGHATDEQRSRFAREARLVASINHPHIVAVYETGTLDDAQYLITELVSGQTLRRWAAATRRSWTEAIDLLIGVGDALACAHQAGILHRDIKPDNILVAQDGYAKLADFGVAKLLDSSAAQQAPDAPVTTAGVAIGTIGYMSPEQLTGDPVDARSDIFSFGVVLYELLAGRAPFRGASPVEVLGAMVQPGAAPASELPTDVPISVRMLVAKALDPEPGTRYQSMKELVVDLKRSRRLGSGVTLHAPARPPRAGTRYALAGLLMATLVFAGTSLLLRERNGTPPHPFEEAQFTRLTDLEGAEHDAAISRDGAFVAYLADQDGQLDLWVTHIATGVHYNLTGGSAPELGNPRVRNVTFSPDAAAVYVWVRVASREGEEPAPAIWRIPTLGGVLQPFLSGAELQWSPDGSQLVYHTDAPGDPLFVATADGTAAQLIFRAEPGVHNHFPTWSPDGEWIYFVQGYPPEETDIWKVPSTGGTPERMTHHNSTVLHPVPLGGSLAYLATAADGSGPWLYSIDVRSRVSRRLSVGSERYLSLSASADGRRLVATVANPRAGLWRVPVTNGTVGETDARRVSIPTARSFSPRLGPNYLLFLSSRGGPEGIWKQSGDATIELWSGLNGRVVSTPTISPDGERIAFTVRRGGRSWLFVMGADGGNASVLAEALQPRGTPAWSPDGRWIALAADAGDGGGVKLYGIPPDGGQPEVLAAHHASDPVWSPDGQFVLYAGPHSGPTFPVQAASLNGSPVRMPDLVLPRGTRVGAFLPDGRSLVVLQGELRHKNFWMIDLQTGAQRQLTEFGKDFIIEDFEVTRDGMEIIFDRREANSDLVLIELPEAAPRR